MIKYVVQLLLMSYLAHGEIVISNRQPDIINRAELIYNNEAYQIEQKTFCNLHCDEQAREIIEKKQVQFHCQIP